MLDCVIGGWLYALFFEKFTTAEGKNLSFVTAPVRDAA